MALIPCCCVSAFYILLTLFITEAARKTVESFIPESKANASPKSALVKAGLLELIAGFDLCACGFELIIIADNYGILAYAVCLFLLTIWWADHWGSATACPYTHFEDCIQGSMKIAEVGVRTAAATLGGLLSFRFMQLLWTMELAETHAGRPHAQAFDICTADLQVSVLVGAVIEGIATLLCRLCSKTMSDGEPEYAGAIDSFIATSLVVAAFDYSGGYYNPVLATGLKYGCRGHSPVEHFVVYWLGASLGAVASVFVYPMIKGQILATKTKAE